MGAASGRRGWVLGSLLAIVLGFVPSSPLFALTDSPEAQAAVDNAQAVWDRLEDDEALRLFQSVVTDYPDAEQAAYSLAMMGLWRWEHNDRTQAFANWNRVIDDYPDSKARLEAWWLMARIARAEQDWDSAAQYYANIAATFPETEEAQKAAAISRWLPIERVPEGRYAEQIAACEAFIAQYPDDPEAAEAKLLIGHNYLWLSEPANALPWYDRIVSEDADSPLTEDALYYRGYCKTVTGDPEGAIEDLSDIAASAEYAGFRVRALHIIASCHERLRQYDETRGALEELLGDTSPEFAEFHPSVLYFMGHTYFAERRDGEALTWLRRLLAQYPTHICAADGKELLALITGAGR